MAAEKEKSSRAKSAMSGEGKSKKAKHRVKEAHVRHAHNGGYIIHHSYEQPEPDEQGQAAPSVPDTDHIAPNMEALQAHMATHMPDENQESEPTATPAPAGV